MRKPLGLLLGTALLTSSIAPGVALAAAETYKLGHVREVVITSSGSVGVDFVEDTSNDHFYACSLAQTRNSVTVETCQGWLTLLTAAQLSGKSVRFDYGTLTPSPTGIVAYIKLYPD
jgi:hypothetical protein